MNKGRALKGDLAEVLRRLPKLSSSDLDQISSRISFLRDTSVSASPAEYDWLMEGFMSELRRRGLWSGALAPRKSVIPGSYAKASAEVRAYLLQNLKTVKLRPMELSALGTLAGSALVDYLTKARVPIGVKTLLLNADKVPAALENAFPGYWAAGLLAFISAKKRA